MTSPAKALEFAEFIHPKIDMTEFGLAIFDLDKINEKGRAIFGPSFRMFNAIDLVIFLADESHDSLTRPCCVFDLAHFIFHACAEENTPIEVDTDLPHGGTSTPTSMN